MHWKLLNPPLRICMNGPHISMWHLSFRQGASCGIHSLVEEQFHKPWLVYESLLLFTYKSIGILNTRSFIDPCCCSDQQRLRDVNLPRLACCCFWVCFYSWDSLMITLCASAAVDAVSHVISGKTTVLNIHSPLKLIVSWEFFMYLNPTSNGSTRR